MTSGATGDRWARVEKLLGDALELDAAGRARLLDEACANDPELRREVSSLLAAHDRSGEFDALAADIAPLGARLQGLGAPPRLSGVIGRYRVVARVAGGGMGVVYKAIDERLGRTVALKFLHGYIGADSSAAERFLHEARAVASLEHPNVCTVYEIGETDDGQLYLAMPLYDGETLQRRIARGPLPLGEAVGIAVQIARGLANAHARGIVHRDIKPSNVFVTDDGVVKILDFGIAKLTDVTLTGPAAGPLGTVAYMSPEQVRAARVDHRADLWALGVVLYEMLTGERPFVEDERADVRTAILERAPSAPSARRSDVPAALDRVVLQALARSPDARHASAQALERELMSLGLVTDPSGDVGRATHTVATQTVPPNARTPSRWLARGALRMIGLGVAVLLVAAIAWRVWPRPVAPRAVSAASVQQPERSLVVLPFVNMSADTGNAYFSDGLTEEITTRLAGVSELKVISRTSAMHYRGTTMPIRRIAEELGVAQVVEGSVRQAGGRLRVTAQLIDARTDAHRWAETFDVEPRDVFQVQERIAREVVRALQVELTERGEQQVARQGTHDPEAYDFYRRGRHFWDMRTREGNAKAETYYKQAIARDPGYADPYAGLALAYLTNYQLHLGDASEAEYFALAKRAAERAVALDDQSSEAHTALAVSRWWQSDWPGAERELRRALELNPGNAMGRSWYGLLMAGMGRIDDAVRESRIAVELDPFAVVMRPNYGRALYVKRDWDRAIEQYRRAFDFSDDWFGSHTELAVVYARVGRHREALAEATRATELSPDNSVAIANLAYVHARAGRTAEAERALAQAKSLAAAEFYVARAYVALGQPDSAFAWLERSPWRWPHRAMRADPALDPIRADPRFSRLSERVDREMGLR